MSRLTSFYSLKLEVLTVLSKNNDYICFTPDLALLTTVANVRLASICTLMYTAVLLVIIVGYYWI